MLEGEETGEREVVGGKGYIVGSMDYIAPEQTLDATAIDGRADIYALGCSLYFTLTGKPPFPGGTNIERMARHRNEEPALLTERNPDVPARFAELIHQMMAKNPEKRPVSVEEVRRELLSWAEPEAEDIQYQQEDVSFRVEVESLQAEAVEERFVEMPSPEVVNRQQLEMLIWFATGVLAIIMFLFMVMFIIGRLK